MAAKDKPGQVDDSLPRQVVEAMLANMKRQEIGVHEQLLMTRGAIQALEHLLAPPEHEEQDEDES